MNVLKATAMVTSRRRRRTTILPGTPPRRDPFVGAIVTAFPLIYIVLSCCRNDHFGNILRRC
jgi:hypothetical protein